MAGMSMLVVWLGRCESHFLGSNLTVPKKVVLVVGEHGHQCQVLEYVVA